jgi:hypothetical protein
VAEVYVYNAAAGAGTGADWANAYTTLKAAVEAAGTVAGDNIWVANDHAETQGSAMAVAFKGTVAAPMRVMSVLRSGGSVPPVAADIRDTAGARATVTTTGGFAITLSGVAAIQGITFNSGSGAASVALTLGGAVGICDFHFKKCALNLLGTSALSFLTLGGGAASVGYSVDMEDTTIRFSNAGHGILMNASATGTTRWRGTGSSVDSAGTSPTSLVIVGGTSGGTLIIEDGVDLSFLVAKTIVPAQSRATRTILRHLKLPALTISANQTAAGAEVQVIQCATTGVTNTLELHNAKGDQTTETTIIRTGGAAQSIKMVAKAGATLSMPFKSLPLIIGNTTAGSPVTFTFYGIWTSGSLPTNGQVWIDLQYLNAADGPSATIATSAPATWLTTPASLTADLSGWGGSTTAFQIAITFTPLLAGDVYATFNTATTTAVYFDHTVTKT